MAKRRKSNKQSRTSAGSSTLFGNTSSGGGDGRGIESGELGVVISPLHELAQQRYLNYALSVITSRALPDVRDGLKPVQRRILYTMWQQRITSEVKHRKCAKVVGDVMGSYHPHGDMAIYDALVRMAQPFMMRVPLIDGSGNFGSLDGDNAAAMRYTECRLTRIAGEILSDISHDTVHFRPNYDGTKNEPVVLPSKVPNLLVNGTTGIAVGMATNIPPHNLVEICNALLKLLNNPELKTYQLVANDAIQGPDFPTGGQVLNSREELREIYKAGSGAIKLRATWKAGPISRGGKTIYITSIPYSVNKAQVVEQIAGMVLSRKIPLLLDVKDLSTDDVRIELQIKKDADDQKVMAYLFKHTPLQSNFNLNLTCLIPTENPQIGRPERSDLREVLWNFLLFRLDVVTRRLSHELGVLEKRIHILNGFVKVFDALDQIIKLIRSSDGKSDAAQKIMKQFHLDADQTEAILELKLYRLAKLEILVIQEELKNKRHRAKEIRKLLAEDIKDTSTSGRWKIVEDELRQLLKDYGDRNKRRTVIESDGDEPEYSAEDFIIAEDNHVLITKDGWVKRQKEIRDPSSTRLREGDSVLACEAGSTRSTIVFFSNYGTAYTSRIIDIPATTGYGEPIQKLFKLKDGERIVAMYSLDARASGNIQEDASNPEYAPPTHAIAASSRGYSLRFGLHTFVEPSTRMGRRYARPAKGSEIVRVEKIHGDETIIAVSKQRRALLCHAEEVNYLSGPGRGVILIKLAKDDVLLDIKAAIDDSDSLVVRSSMGGEQKLNGNRYESTGRGGKGREIIKRGQIVEVVPAELSAPVLLDDDEE